MSLASIMMMFHQLLTTWTGFGTLLLALSLLLLLVLVTIRLSSTSLPQIKIFPDERYYFDPVSGERHPLPQIGTIVLSKRDAITYQDFQPFTVHLTVVVPAYNEQDRLPLMLDEAFEYLERQSYKYEVLIVDDGSTDKTTEVGSSYVQKFGTDRCRVITLRQNRGKGGAIRMGVLASRGEYLLFADADGATKFEDIEKLQAFVRQRETAYSKTDLLSFEKNFGVQFDRKMFPIAIGSRAHLEKDSIATRSLFRTILMYGFHFVVWLLTVRTVRDTQCGFKMFPRSIALVLFTHMHVERWAFDVELLVLAERLCIPIGEIPVRWTEIEGSKLVPVFSWIQMGIDVGLIFVNYLTGAHRLPKSPFQTIPGLSIKTKNVKIN